VTVSDDEGRSPTHHASGSGHNKLVDVDDPFADPFAG
jgi:LAS seventeen-binding protein 5